MRQAGWDSGWHLDSHGEVIGFSLHGDSCTEHEVGISELKACLGMKKAPYNGIADRVNTRIPQGFAFQTYQDKDGNPAACLLVNDRMDPSGLDPANSFSEARFRTASTFRSRNDEERARDEHRERFGAAWDSEGFFIRVKGQGYVDRLSKMAKAIENHDLTLGGYLIEETYMPGKTQVGGLTFARASKVSAKMAEELLAKDQSRLRLDTAAATILPGLTVTLQKAGKRWFALTPRWRDEQETEVVFWLNPMEQSDHNFGQFSAADLQAWARNEGPIMIDKELVYACRRMDNLFERLQKQFQKDQQPRMNFSVERVPNDTEKFQVNVTAASKDQSFGVEPGVYTEAELTAKLRTPARSPRRSVR